MRGQHEPPEAVPSHSVPAPINRVVALAATAMALCGLLLGHGTAQAQTPTPTPLPFATQVTPLQPDELAPGDDLVFYGDAFEVSATQYGVPMATGARFPTGEPSLALSLSYTDPLPAAIPSADLLEVYYYNGTAWNPIAANYTATAGGGTFEASVSRVGDYAIGADLRILVSPSTVTLRPGETQQFTATLLDGDDNPVEGVTVEWQVTSAAGTITEDGLFTARGSVGLYDRAVVASLGSLEGYADVELELWTTFVPMSLQSWEMQLQPDDPWFQWQWNLEVIRAPQAWADSTGGAVTVAVIDSGVDSDHPDLADNLVAGCNFLLSRSICIPATDDDYWHGTHVAGIVAAVGNNSVGVAGTAWEAQIMPLKVLDENGDGYVSDAVVAIRWAVNHGARVINLSFGTDFSSAIDALGNAINYALQYNVLVVAAAGNMPPFTLGQAVYPANFAGVVGVGSTNQLDQLSQFSSQGRWVDVVAPGESVLSTYPGGAYEYHSGTSMACPHVAGLAALLLGRYPQLSATEVASIIYASAEDLGLDGYDTAYGYGRIDAAAAMQSVTSALSSFSGLSLGGAAAESPEAEVEAQATESEEVDPDSYRPGYLIVEADATAVASARAAVLGQTMSAQAAEELMPGWSLIRVPEGSEPEMLAELAEQPGVLGVYYDALIHAQ